MPKIFLSGLLVFLHPYSRDEGVSTFLITGSVEIDPLLAGRREEPDELVHLLTSSESLNPCFRPFPLIYVKIATFIDDSIVHLPCVRDDAILFIDEADVGYVMLCDDMFK